MAPINDQKFCSQCGSALIPGARFCPGCGRDLYQQNRNLQSSSQVNYASQSAVHAAPAAAPAKQMTKKEYRKVCTLEKYRKNLKSSAIVLYILIAINALVAIGTNPWSLIDVGIYLVLTLVMHLKKNKGCAVGVLLYAIVNMVILLVENGTFGGYLWLIAAINALQAFSVADKEYKSIYG